jgi:hypothetical protein
MAFRLTVLAVALSLAACHKQTQSPAVPPTVEYVTMQDRLVTLTDQLPGRTSAYETSDVRPPRRSSGATICRFMFMFGCIANRSAILSRPP